MDYSLKKLIADVFVILYQCVLGAAAMYAFGDVMRRKYSVSVFILGILFGLYASIITGKAQGSVFIIMIAFFLYKNKL
jgi:hypothetical protein